MTQNYRLAAAALAAAIMAGGVSAQATVITQTLGTADFTDGQAAIGTANFSANLSVDPAPFDRLIGNKNIGPLFPSASFTFSGYGGAIAATITAATLQFGLYDGASPVPAAEVNTVTLGGTNLAAVATAAFVGNNPIRNGEKYYTLALPAATFADLATGTAAVTVTLQGPGEGVLGPSAFILVGLDFSTLTITTGPTPPPPPPPPPPPLPEPASLALLGVGLLGLASFRRARLRG